MTQLNSSRRFPRSPRSRWGTTKHWWVAAICGAIAVGLLLLSSDLPQSRAIAQDYPTAPVTSVSQFSDVQPSDPYFAALQALTEQYGCVTGFSDGTFRANQPVTRGETAIVLYNCLSKLAEVLQAQSP